MYKWPLTDSTTIKDHNVVAHVHEAPHPGDSVVETDKEETMKDVATGRTIGLLTAEKMEETMVDMAAGRAVSLPTLEQLHKITRQELQHQAAPATPSR